MSSDDIVECICGADIKQFTLNGEQGWIHVETLDDRCYPENPEDSECKAEPLEQIP